MPLAKLRRDLQAVEHLPTEQQQEAMGKFVQSLVKEVQQLTSRVLQTIGVEIDTMRTRVLTTVEPQAPSNGEYNLATALGTVRHMIEGLLSMAQLNEQAALRNREETEEVDHQVLRCLYAAWEAHSKAPEKVRDGMTISMLAAKVNAAFPRDITEADVDLSLKYLERRQCIGRTETDEAPQPTGDNGQEGQESDGDVRYVIHTEGMTFLEGLPVDSGKTGGASAVGTF